MPDKTPAKAYVRIEGVDAVRLGDDNGQQITEWIRASGTFALHVAQPSSNKPLDVRVTTASGAVLHAPGIVIHAAEGDLIAERGDWIIRDAAGRFDVVSQQIFEEQYTVMASVRARGATWEEVRADLAFTPEEEAEIKEIREQQMAAQEDRAFPRHAKAGAAYDDLFPAHQGPIPKRVVDAAVEEMQMLRIPEPPIGHLHGAPPKQDDRFGIEMVCGGCGRRYRFAHSDAPGWENHHEIKLLDSDTLDNEGVS